VSAGMTTGASLHDVLRRSTEYLERHGVPSARANVETLLMHLLRTDRAGLYARREGLDTATAKALGRALCQRCAGTPLQHLTGEQAFLGLLLRVDPGVFVPRPETEVLALHAIGSVEGVERPTVVDVGTGTGAVALAVAQARPDARVVATDVSEPAVMLARANARRLGLRVEVLLGDLLSPLPARDRSHVDLLVSNPPYVTAEAYEGLPEEVRREPFEALVGGIRVHARLAELAPTWLRPGGWLLVEIGDDQWAAVPEAFHAAGLTDVMVLPDLAGRDRVVRGRRDPAG
jgi:release factor glutamine methyltransferase